MLALTFAAFFAVASGADEPPPPPELAQAADAWGKCMQDQVDEADRELSPARVVDGAIAACLPMQETMLAQHRRWIEGSSLSDREKRDALRAMERSLTEVRPAFMRMVREMRRD